MIEMVYSFLKRSFMLDESKSDQEEENGRDVSVIGLYRLNIPREYEDWMSLPKKNCEQLHDIDNVFDVFFFPINAKDYINTYSTRPCYGKKYKMDLNHIPYVHVVCFLMESIQIKKTMGHNSLFKKNFVCT